SQPGKLVAVQALLQDRRGDLWIGTGRGLLRRRPDGRLERYTTDQHRLPNLGEITGLLEDRHGRIWLATRWHGLPRLGAEPLPDRPIVADRFFLDTGHLSGYFLSLFQSSDERLWAGRHNELTEIILSEPSGRVTFRRFTAANGLEGIGILALNEDRDGNLWLGGE